MEGIFRLCLHYSVTENSMNSFLGFFKVIIFVEFIDSVQFTQSCPTLCDPMDFSKPGLPIHHQLLKFAHTRVHWVGDAFQLFHPMSSPSLPAFNLSQHQGIFHWVGCLHQVAKSIGASASASVPPMAIQDWFLLGLTSLISLLSKGHSRVFCSTTVQKHQFFSAQPSLWSSSHIHIWLLEKP